MARMSAGNWIRRIFSGSAKVGHALQVGTNVLTNDGALLGTIVTVWQGSDDSDGTPHGDTLEVRRAEEDPGSVLYIPASAIASTSERGVVLAVATDQITARGWRFRPIWLPPDAKPQTGRSL